MSEREGRVENRVIFAVLILIIVAIVLGIYSWLSGAFAPTPE